MPPMVSFSRRDLAFLYSTKGSAPSTRALEVMVSVAVMPTLASLMPQAAQMPFFLSTLGLAVYRMGSSGSGISTWDSTLLYLRGCFFGSTTTVFLMSKWPSSVRAIMVEPSLLASFPTNRVVQGMGHALLLNQVKSSFPNVTQVRAKEKCPRHFVFFRKWCRIVWIILTVNNFILIGVA